MHILRVLGLIGVLAAQVLPVYVAPSVGVIWQRENAEEVQHISITPVMKRVVDKLAASTNVTSFANLFRKLSAGSYVNVMVLGGSFTSGAGCNNKHRDAGCKWSARFIDWLQLAYPRSKVNLIDGALPSTSSFRGLNTIQQVSRSVDLLLVDYSLNL